MNRFQVPDETAEEFEEMWLSRESHLHEEHGFVEFHMLKGPSRDGITLYA
ncbi:MAG: antibiotic biosynthesis monooxygenase, partial [Pseudomonadota bacterium]